LSCALPPPIWGCGAPPPSPPAGGSQSRSSPSPAAAGSTSSIPTATNWRCGRRRRGGPAQRPQSSLQRLLDLLLLLRLLLELLLLLLLLELLVLLLHGDLRDTRQFLPRYRDQLVGQTLQVTARRRIRLHQRLQHLADRNHLSGELGAFDADQVLAVEVPE